MKRCIAKYIISFIFISISCVAGENLATTRITRWQGNAKGAFSFTFDDGSPGQAQYAVPILNKYSLKGTFFLIGMVTTSTSDGRIHIPTMLSISNAGHEIGYHTYNHLDLTKLDNDAIDEQMQKEKSIFDYWGIRVISLAYPYSMTDERVQSIVKKYVHFARTGGSPLVANSSVWGEVNPLALRWSCGSSTQASISRINEVIETGEWAIGVYHHIGYPEIEGPTVLQFEELARYVREMQDENYIWCDTFRNIASYMYERDNAKIIVGDHHSEGYIVVFVDIGKGEPFNVPLTLMTNIGNYYVSSVEQNGQVIPWGIEKTTDGRNVKYNIIPDANRVIIRLSTEQGEPHCAKNPKMDFNGDCIVNICDFYIFAQSWLDSGYDRD